MQAQDLIDEVLHMTGVVADADTPSTDQRNKVLALFNAMLDTWNGEGLLSPYQDTASFDLVIGTNTYTIGPSGADFTAARPLELSMAEIRDSSNQDSLLYVISWAEMEALDSPLIARARPTRITYQKKPTTGVIKLYPPPDAAYSLRLTTSNLFSALTLSSTIDNNPGYLEAFKYNLAPRTAIYYSKTIDGGIVVLGENCLRVLRRKAMPLGNAPVASGVITGNSRFNIDRGY